MQQEFVEYRDEMYSVLITVRAARVIDGIRRACIIAEQPTEPAETYLARTHTYAACVCSVESIENPALGKRPLLPSITVEEFLELPEALVLLWVDAAYSVNQHWLPSPVPQTAEEKVKLAAHQQELDKRLILWHKRQDSPAVEEGEEDEEWRVHDLEGAFKIWCLLQGLDWGHLPYGGGLLDQPEALMNDLVTISWRKGIIGERMKPAPAMPAGQVRGRRR